MVTSYPRDIETNTSHRAYGVHTQDRNERRLWLIDGGYLFSAQVAVSPGYQFDYLKLRQVLEEMGGPIWRAYYLNAMGPGDRENGGGQERFHTWLQSAPPSGPKIITMLYNLRDSDVSHAYCKECGLSVNLQCPRAHTAEHHTLSRRVQKGVDVGLASLALTQINSYDTLTLSSGDGDLLDAIRYISYAGKNVELAVFKYGVATELQSWADRIYWIDDFAEEVARE